MEYYNGNWFHKEANNALLYYVVRSFPYKYMQCYVFIYTKHYPII